MNVKDYWRKKRKKKKRVGRGSFIKCWLGFDMWALHSKMETINVSLLNDNINMYEL